MENLSIVGRNTKWPARVGKSMAIPQTLKIGLSCDPSNPLLVYAPKNGKKAVIQTENYTLMFIAAPFSITETWKWPKYPWVERTSKEKHINTTGMSKLPGKEILTRFNTEEPWGYYRK